jgi:5-methylcytosine-specific restriction endonuclease McrA
MADTLGDYYRLAAIPKPEPHVVTKTRRQKQSTKDERACRYVVRVRDKGRCRIPNCNGRDVEMHHIIPRSRSSRLKWQPSNNVLLCRDHHRLRHAGVIQISGDGDGEIVVTGDVDRLRFRL